MSDIECKAYRLKTKGENWLAQIVLTNNGVMYAISEFGNFNVAWIRGYKTVKKFERFIENIDPDCFVQYVIRFNKDIDSDIFRKKLELFKTNVFIPFQKTLQESGVRDE